MTTEPTNHQPTTHFVFYHSPGPNWIWGKKIWEQPEFQHHVDYLTEFFDRGNGVLGGPFQDGSGGMTVLEFANLDEAQQVANADPAVQAKILQVQVLAWVIAKTR